MNLEDFVVNAISISISGGPGSHKVCGGEQGSAGRGVEHRAATMSMSSVARCGMHMDGSLQGGIGGGRPATHRVFVQVKSPAGRVC